MYVDANQIQQGIIKYISADMLPKVDGWKKIVFGASLELLSTQKLAEQILASPYISMLGITDGNGLIDVDKLKDALEHQMGMQKIDIEIPLIGTYKIGQSDIERICQIIKGDDR